MDPSSVLRQARRRAGLTQRELGRRAAVPQSVVARIEAGATRPRVDTLDRLLAACGESLTVTPRLGVGVDRTLIHRMLRMTPRRRVEDNVAAAKALARVRGRARREVR